MQRRRSGQVFFIEMALAIVGVIVIGFAAAKILQWLNASIGGTSAGYQGTRIAAGTDGRVDPGGGGVLHIIGPGGDFVGMGGGGGWMVEAPAAGCEGSYVSLSQEHRQTANDYIIEGRKALRDTPLNNAFDWANWAALSPDSRPGTPGSTSSMKSYIAMANYMWILGDAAAKLEQARNDECWAEVCSDWSSDSCGGCGGCPGGNNETQNCSYDPIGCGGTGGYTCETRSCWDERDCFCWNDRQDVIDSYCAEADGWRHPDDPASPTFDVEGPAYGPRCYTGIGGTPESGVKECSVRLQEASAPVYAARNPREPDAVALLENTVFDFAQKAFEEITKAEEAELDMLGDCAQPP